MKDFIKGMDVSSLLEEEACGAKFYDNGEEGDAIEILKRYGANSVRLRLWNDPYTNDKKPYGAGTNDLEKTIALARRAKSAGMSFLFDIHYSDFWADPGKQTMPKAWRGMGIKELEKAVYEFTKESVKALNDAGVTPEMVQVGNEITNGLCWPVGKKDENDPVSYDNIEKIISSGIRAVREVSPESEIMIHLDNGGFNSMYVDWFDNYTSRNGEDFDIIGMSYYPFWHGTMDELKFNMEDMNRRYGKDIVIAEVSYGFSTEDYRRYEGGEIEDHIGSPLKGELLDKVDYPLTPQGQSDFMQRIMEMNKNTPGGRGFYYWEPAWVPVPGCGWATEEALIYTGETGRKGGNEWANQALFDYDGNALPALKKIRDF